MKNLKKIFKNYFLNIFDSIFNIKRDKKRIIDSITDKFGTKVNDSVFTLNIINNNRTVIYERGVAQRLRYLAKYYGLGTSVPIEREDRIINVGANIGEVTILCCLHGAEVLAIEGNPYAYECLKSNCHGFNARLFNEVLWKENAKVTFRNQNGGTSSTIIGIGDLPPGVDNVVNAKTLDKVYETAFQDDSIEIKAIVGDVEGAEPELLLGAQNLLKKVHYISLDCGPERIGKQNSYNLVADYLKENNFRVMKPRNNIKNGTILIAENLNIKN